MRHKEIRLLRLRPAGMFSNVNEVIYHLHLAEISNYAFKIDWSNSSYKSDKRLGDPWRYYFEDCFELGNIEISSLPLVEETLYNESNFITPYFNDALMLPDNRPLANRYIEKYLRFMPQIIKRIDAFMAKHDGEQIIGLHIRGPLRTDAGGAIRSKLKLKKGIPFNLYYNPVKDRLKQFPDAKVLICSDSQMVIDETRSEFGSRVITYDAIRSKKGEMHVRNGLMPNENIDPYILGEDMLVESELLARSSFFDHGYSNVANYVLCRSPEMESHYAYAELADANLSEISVGKLTFQTKVLGQRFSGAVLRRLARLGGKLR